MLVRASTIKSLPVISLLQGKKVATVKDYLYDPYDNKISAFILRPISLFGSDKYLLLGDVKSIGKDALIIPTSLSLKDASDMNKDTLMLKKYGGVLTEGRLVTESGEKLGTVRDLLFNSENGQVEKLEITQGGFANFKSGPKMIDIENIISMGPDTTIVQIRTAEDLKAQEQTQGLQGKLNEANSKLESGIENLKEKVTSYFTEPTQTSISPLAHSHPHSLSDLAVDLSMDEKPQPVYTPDLNTEKSPQNQEIFQSLKDTLKSSKDRAEEKFGQYQSVAYNQISRVNNDRIEKQKQNAVGLFLTKTILDDEDNILAKRGDIITHKLLLQAENLGILDQILKNTSYDPIS